MMSESKSRIPPLKRAEWTDEARDVFAVMEGPEGWNNGPSVDVIAVLAQHPPLTRPFLVYSRHLLFNSTLPERVRELVTLYVAWTTKSDYEWASHVPMALHAGLTDSDIEAVKQGPGSAHWSGLDRDLLRAVDQMRDGHDLDDELWASLSKEFDRRQMMDLLFTIGNYIMFSAVLSGMRVSPEARSAEVMEKYGSPLD